jgi:hypothetical protein
MDRDEAFAQVRAHIEQSEVETLKGKWEASRTYCVAPADVRLSLHVLVKGALTSESPEEIKHYLRRMENILEWVWPHIRERFDVYKLGEDLVQIPVKK